ncbi:biotin--[acetyl-CoA-carboxylase] ligase [Rickettsia prowazekii]|nr:biotin--[acetyl-CoA-carboxylase] ligase [Rickettsia prowazekii]ADE30062.1 Biotin-(acetyl-CoAcarboxylase) ligase [Rickettsia prowazekii str. Rp22]AFE49337.1 biotin--protein ligase [Rickettsia prowazekii str. Chernikova]AFE50181.1 biotin--protein ligase [Rickettsia prowazekii str. Katsinyian]AFE51027.1 biotin--protein ligase [Rickettsia prowazekii str. BuV67-CWPP]AFE51863.1 biotin--protein ligase [Rickettsia prowazekii str. Dachau]
MNIGKFKLIVFDEIDSTSSEAMRIARHNKVYADYAIFAKSQTRGRGRSGKNWQSRLGNLHVSLLMRPDKELELLPQLCFVTALAVYDTILSCILYAGSNQLINNFNAVSVCPQNYSIQLKWPNDILMNGRKIAGILLESVKMDNNYYLIIGIGINITYHPENIDQPTTSLITENLMHVVPKALLKILIKNFEKYYKIWHHNGFPFIRKKWIEHAYKLNENINIKYRNDIVTGLFKDIDNTGNIILQLNTQEIISFSTAELYF